MADKIAASFLAWGVPIQEAIELSTRPLSVRRYDRDTGKPYDVGVSQYSLKIFGCEVPLPADYRQWVSEHEPTWGFSLRNPFWDYLGRYEHCPRIDDAPFNIVHYQQHRPTLVGILGLRVPMEPAPSHFDQDGKRTTIDRVAQVNIDTTAAKTRLFLSSLGYQDAFNMYLVRYVK